MKKKIGLTALAVVVCIVCVIAYNFGTANKSTKDVEKNEFDKYAKVQKYDKDKKLYQYTLYNLKGEKVYEEKKLSGEPIVKQLKSGIIKVIIPAGTGVSQTRYYDYKTEKISEIFIFCSFSMYQSVSICLSPYFSESFLPMVDFPEPINPIKIIFFMTL